MRKSLLTLALLGAIVPICATNDESNTDTASQLTPEMIRERVADLSDERIAQAKAELTAKERRRNIIYGATKLAFAGLGIYGVVSVISGMTERWGAQDALEYQQRADAIDVEKENKEKIEEYEKQKEKEAKKDPVKKKDDPGWFSWAGTGLWNGTKNFGSDMLGWAPSLLKQLGASYVLGECMRYVFPALPSVENYLLERHSINWCLLRNTQFYFVCVTLMNWVMSVHAQPEELFSKRYLAVTGNQFVIEMEKVLAYMQYATEQLDTKDDCNMVYTELGNLTIEKIAYEVIHLAQEMNTLLEKEEVTTQMKKTLIDSMRRRLAAIITQMEDFQVVTILNEMGSEEEPDLFGPLKDYVFPEWHSVRPEIEKAEPDMREEAAVGLAQHIGTIIS